MFLDMLVDGKKVQPFSGSYLGAYDATNKQSWHQMEKLMGFLGFVLPMWA